MHVFPPRFATSSCPELNLFRSYPPVRSKSSPKTSPARDSTLPSIWRYPIRESSRSMLAYRSSFSCRSSSSSPNSHTSTSSYPTTVMEAIITKCRNLGMARTLASHVTANGTSALAFRALVGTTASEDPTTPSAPETVGVINRLLARTGASEDIARSSPSR
ncbi:hypothetical protein CPB86DRAFT_184802 [Serendipita vermifera]|nr:hypothetical protein CPB86DRAFT_184802 [Serendipita vermifera]